MDNEYAVTLKDVKRVLKKRVKLILIISLLAMIGGGAVGLKPSKKEVETKVAILVDKPISKEERDKGDYDYLRFINAKNVAGPTELAKSQKIMKKVISAVDVGYDLKQATKSLVVTNNLDANMIYINVKGNSAEHVNKMVDIYTQEFLKEAKTIYSDTNFTVLDKENIDQIKDNLVAKSIKFAIIGIILGLFIAVGIAFGLEMLDKTVKDEDELEVLGLRVLTVIPNHKE